MRVTPSLFVPLAFLTGSLLLNACQSGSPGEPASNPAWAPAHLQLPPDQALLGGFTLELSRTPELAAAFTPDRAPRAIGDVYNEVGLSGALKGDLCDCFAVRGLELIGPETVRVTFRVRHPFTPEIRPDLHAFNLKTHVVTGTALPVHTEQVDAGRILNADGYSALWVSQVPAAPQTLFPYVIFSRDSSAPAFDFRSPAGWNVFAAGQSYEAHLDFHIPAESQVQVRLYLTVDYGQSAVRATRQTPEYELPRFAGKAPWRVAVTELVNDLEGGQASSFASYRLDVWDWGHGAGIGTDVTGAVINVPGLGVSASYDTFTGTGFDPEPLTLDFPVSNVLAAPGGTYWGLVEVTDEAVSGTGIRDDLVTPFAVNLYSTWMLFPVVVAPGSGNQPPSAVIAEPLAGPVMVNVPVTFDGTGSSDPEDDPGDLLYEWDFDYDGLTFDVQAAGLTTLHTYTTLGPVTAALRVTDTGSLSDIATVTLEVESPGGNTPPVAVIGDLCQAFTVTVGEALTFDGSGSYDAETPTPLLIFEWDFNYAAPVFNVMATGVTTPYSFPAPGSYVVALRVTDEGGLTHIATVTIKVVAQFWRHQRAVVTAFSDPFPQWQGFANNGQRVFFDSNGDAHLFYFQRFNTPTEHWITRIIRLGTFPDGPLGTATVLADSGPPSVSQDGDILHMGRVTVAQTAVLYQQLNLLTHAITATQTAMPIPAGFGAGAVWWDWELARDPSSGNVFAAGTVYETSPTVKWHLYGAERSSSGSWSAPALIDSILQNPAWPAMTVAPDGDMLLLYNDTIGNPGAGHPQTTYYLKRSFGTPWSGYQQTGMPNGRYFTGELYTAPNGDAIAVCQRGVGASSTAQYLHWRAATNTWTTTRVGNLPLTSVIPQMTVDLSGLVTVVIEHQDSITPRRRIISRQFRWDADPALIQNGTCSQLVHVDPAVNLTGPSVAAHPTNGTLAAVWERPAGGGNMDVWMAVHY